MKVPDEQVVALWSRLDALDVVPLQRRPAALLGLRRASARLRLVRSKLKTTVAILKARLLKYTFRPGKKYVSVEGGYSLAIKRNWGHASAKDTVRMLAAEPYQGALKHKDVVLRYEMRAAMAQQALMRSFYHEHYDEMVARGNEMAVEVHLYRGDATNQDAVQRMPVQTSELASVLVSSEALHGWAEGTIALQLPYKRTLGDLQILSEKTGENLRALILRQMRQVGCPTWVQRAQELQREIFEASERVSVYVFVLDNGGDNQLATRLIRKEVSARDRIMMITVWCFVHQYQLVVKRLLADLNAWTWPDRHWGETSYTTGVSAISNAWRSSGNHCKIVACGARLYGPVVAQRYLSKIPGRVLAGRWGSIDSVESVLTKATDYLGHPAWWVCGVGGGGGGG